LTVWRSTVPKGSVGSFVTHDGSEPLIVQVQMKLLRRSKDRIGGQPKVSRRLYLAVNEIDPTRTKAQSPQTNGMACARFADLLVRTQTIGAVVARKYDVGVSFMGGGGSPPNHRPSLRSACCGHPFRRANNQPPWVCAIRGA
jgi:hypothetical protein